MSRDVQVVSNFRVEITHKEISDYLLKQEGIIEFHKNNKLTLQGRHGMQMQPRREKTTNETFWKFRITLGTPNEINQVNTYHLCLDSQGWYSRLITTISPLT
jgi:hypothetical protein